MDIHAQLLPATLDMTSLNHFRSELIVKTVKNPASWRFRVEFLKNGLSKDRKILHTYQIIRN